jgi:hypothetical protein
VYIIVKETKETKTLINYHVRAIPSKQKVFLQMAIRKYEKGPRNKQKKQQEKLCMEEKTKNLFEYIN